MGMGWTVSLHPIMREHKSAANVSLGIDCHLSNPSSIALQARALLRLAQDSLPMANFQPPMSAESSSEEAFNLMTIRGARRLGLERRGRQNCERQECRSRHI
jgi:cytosine/adenosine deaminase-related metal-dependent hydrolase